MASSYSVIRPPVAKMSLLPNSCETIMDIKAPVGRAPISIGFDSDVLYSGMTGVGNYCFHLLKALMLDYTELRFSGFTGLRWQHVGPTDLDRYRALSKQTSAGNGIQCGEFHSATLARKERTADQTGADGRCAIRLSPSSGRAIHRKPPALRARPISRVQIPSCCGTCRADATGRVRSVVRALSRGTSASTVAGPRGLAGPY